MFTINFADGRNITVEAVDEAAARAKAYRFERSQAIASIIPA